MKKIVSMIGAALLLSATLSGCNSNSGQTEIQADTTQQVVEEKPIVDVNEANKQKGAEFMAKKAEEGYTKTASGLLYKVLTPGNGAQFTGNKPVMVKYVGKHIDGQEFDNSHGEAVPFELNSVIPGFSEMIKLMKPGMKVEVVIPPNLGYGDRGIGDLIKPGETLVFEMETVGEVPAENR